MTRNQQLMVMGAEALMALGLMHLGYKTYREKGFDDLPTLVLSYGAGVYLAYGAYLNYNGRVQILSLEQVEDAK